MVKLKKKESKGDVKKAKIGKSKKNEKSEKQMEKMVDDAVDSINKISSAMNGSNGEGMEQREITFSVSKPIAQVKKGDKIKIDGKDFEVDAHYLLIDHGSTKEMAVELFDSNDNDYQLRYFDDQVESTLDFYELQEIMYIKRPFSKISW